MLTGCLCPPLMAIRYIEANESATLPDGAGPLLQAVETHAVRYKDPGFSSCRWPLVGHHYISANEIRLQPACMCLGSAMHTFSPVESAINKSHIGY